MLASLALLISAAVGLAGTGPSADAGASLRARGWQALDQVACEGLRAGRYYELGNDEATAELLAVPGGGVLVSHLPLPEAPYECREVTEPHFVEEIR